MSGAIKGILIGLALCFIVLMLFFIVIGSGSYFVAKKVEGDWNSAIDAGIDQGEGGDALKGFAKDANRRVTKEVIFGERREETAEQRAEREARVRDTKEREADEDAAREQAQEDAALYGEDSGGSEGGTEPERPADE